MKRAELLLVWWRHVRMPLVMFVPLAGVLAFTHADAWIAHTLFFDEGQWRWIGADSWWTNDLLHTGGRWFIRAMVAAALLTWTGSYLSPGLRDLRRPAGYFIVASVLAMGIVGLLKNMTNVHCPWDLAPFGGRFPFVELFSARDPGTSPGQCFPAAHSSSGYALLSLYFVFRDHSKIPARWGLVLGIITGSIFGIAQQSRGAHFLSHDVWSAFIVWTLSASIYTLVFRARLWNGIRHPSPGFTGYETPVAAHRPAADAVDLRNRTRRLPRAARG